MKSTPRKHFVRMFLAFRVLAQEHKTLQKGWDIQEMMKPLLEATLGA